MHKRDRSPLELDDILSFVLFLLAISFLAYVLMHTISTIQLQAPDTGGDICASENETSP